MELVKFRNPLYVNLFHVQLACFTVWLPDLSFSAVKLINFALD